MAIYDVNEVIAHFQRGGFPERKNLIEEISRGLASSPAAKRLLAEIGYNAMQNEMVPTEALSLGIMYGVVLGILMEKERARRIQ